MNHGTQKKMAIINDISGFGRCSVTVALPIISHMKIQGCILPTSIFSNHTGYEDYFFDDYTDKMKIYAHKWKKLGITFDGITTGFLGSSRQIEIVEAFIKDFKGENTKVIIDPVMGDDGRAYATYTKDMCQQMKRLIGYGDIITPNVTEACILSDTPYKKTGWKKEEIINMLTKLAARGAKQIVLSGISMGDYLGNAILDQNGEITIQRVKRVGIERAGTGDLFAAIIAADCVNGVEIKKSVRKASSFVKKAIMVTETMNVPPEDGVCFEEIIGSLS